jgi:cytochrome b561
MTTDTSTSPRANYDGVAISLHWLVFLGVLALFASVQVIERLPRGDATRMMLTDAHKLGGLIVLALVLLRILWRAIRGAPELVPTNPVTDFIAKASHGLLNLLMIAMPLSGLAMTAAAGRGIAALGIPSVLDKLNQVTALVGLPLLEKSESLAKQLHEAHEMIFVAILALVLLHAVAALWHHYIRHDATLGRMVPWLRKQA